MLYLFDQDDIFLSLLVKETGLVDIWFKDYQNHIIDEPFTFKIKSSSPKLKYIESENQVAFHDRDGKLRLMRMKQLYEETSQEESVIRVVCEPSYLELYDHFIEDKRYVSKTAQNALDGALQGSRYVGEVAVELGLETDNFYWIDGIEAVFKILEAWGGALKDTITLDAENEIIERKIWIVQRLGADNGLIVEPDFNAEQIERKTLSYVETALWGQGSSLEITDDDDEHTGGYTRYITFEDIVWSKSKGDPVDKPKGQKWVGDPQALNEYGYLHNGIRKHRYGHFSNQDYETPEELLMATWLELQERKLKEIIHEATINKADRKISLGDTVTILNRKYNKPIELQSQITGLEYDVLNADENITIIVGKYIDMNEDPLQKDVDDLKNEAGKPKPTKPITDKSFPDIVPGIPVNVDAVGGIGVIQLYWDYDSKVYMSHYEVYGSQVADFVPDSQHLLYRGRVSAFAHTVDTDKKWYYYLRAVNTRGTPSGFSVRVEASSVRVISDDILFGPDIAEKLRELSKTAALLADGTIDLNQLTDEARKIIEDAQVNIKNAEDRLSVAEGRVGNAETNISDLQKNLGLAEGEIERVDEELDTAQGRLDDAQDAIDNANTNIGNLEGALGNKADTIYVDERIQYTNQEIIDTENRLLGQLNTEIGDVNTSIGDLNSVADNLKNRVNATDDLLSQHGGKFVSIEQEINEIDGRIFTTINKVESIDNTVQSHGLKLIAQADLIGAKLDSLEYQRDINGVINRIESNELDIQATARGLDLRVTKEEFEALEIGGRNIIPEFGKWVRSPLYALDGPYEVVLPEGASGGSPIIRIDIPVIPNTEYTITVNTLNGRSQVNGLTSESVLLPLATGNSIRTFNSGDNEVVQVSMNKVSTQMNEVRFTYPKLEKGNKATDWSPAPEDVDGAISSVSNRVTTTETDLKVHAGWINAKVERDEVYTRTETNGLLGDKVSFNEYSNKMTNLDLTIDGLNTTVSNTSATVNELSGEIVNAKSQIANLDVRAGGIELGVSDIRKDLSGTQSDVAAINVKADGIISTVESIQIGVRNLARGTDSKDYIQYSGGSITYTEGTPTISIRVDGVVGGTFGIQQNNPHRTMELIKGVEYTLSLLIRGDVQTINYPYLMKTVGGNQSIPNFTVASSTEYTPISVSFIYTGDSPYSYLMLTSRLQPVGTWFEVKNIKVEKGNKATDWTPAPEDTDLRMTKSESSIIQLADSMELKVDVGGIVSALELYEGNARLKGKNITLDGNTLITGNLAAGSATFLDMTTRNMTAISATINNSTVTGTLTATNATITRGTFNDIIANRATLANATVTGTIGAANATFTNATMQTMTAINSTFQNSTITGTLTATNTTILSGTFNKATIVDATIQNAKITGELVAVTGSFAGVITGTAVIGTLALANGSVTNLKIGTGAVDTLQVKDGAINNAKIANLNADKINAGAIRGIDIYGAKFRSSNGNDWMEIVGGNINLTKANGQTVEINTDGFISRNSNGSTRFEMDRFVVRSNALAAYDSNVYLAPKNGYEVRVVKENEIPGDGNIESYSYQDVRAAYFYGDGMINNAARGIKNIALRPDYDDGEVRVLKGLGERYADLRASTIFAQVFNINGQLGDVDHIYIRPHEEVRFTQSNNNSIYADIRLDGAFVSHITLNGQINNVDNLYIRTINEVRLTSTNSTTNYRNMRLDGAYVSHITVNAHVNTDGILYLRSSNEIRSTGVDSTTLYRPIRASAFNQASSREYKTNIVDLTVSALDIINSLKIVEYDLKDDLANGVVDRQIGLIAEDSLDVSTVDNMAINMYKLTSLNTKSIQEIDTKVIDISDRVGIHDLKIQYLEQKLKQEVKTREHLELRIQQLEGVA